MQSSILGFVSRIFAGTHVVVYTTGWKEQTDYSYRSAWPWPALGPVSLADRVQVFPGLSDSDARLQQADHPQDSHLYPLGFLLRIQGQRQQQFSLGISRGAEVGRHHTDDGVDLAVESERLPKYMRIRAQRSLPKSMSDHRRPTSAGPVLLNGKCTAQAGLRP